VTSAQTRPDITGRAGPALNYFGPCRVWAVLFFPCFGPAHQARPKCTPIVPGQGPSIPGRRRRGTGQKPRSPCSALLSSALLCASATGPHCQTSTVGNELGIPSSHSLHHALQELYCTIRDEVMRTSGNPIASPARVAVAICKLDQQLVPFKNDHQGLLIRANQSSSPAR
jgi:hypothetical protein